MVTEKWIELFNKYKIGIEVSIDGPSEYNDKYRIDHNNNGSYDRLIRGIKLLQDKLINPPGCLTVINPEFSGSIIYKHLVELGFKSIDFLLPDNNYHTPPTHDISKYTLFLLEVFNEWMKSDNDEITIRKFKTIILQLLGESPLLYGFGKSKEDNIPLLSIRSDGEISPSDELMSTDPNTVIFIDKNVSSSTLSEVLGDKIFHELKQATVTPPKKCSKCCWYNACGGGILVSRYSKENRFNNPSVYCNTYQEVFANIATHLIKNGISKDIITNKLLHNSIPMTIS